VVNDKNIPYLATTLERVMADDTLNSQLKTLQKNRIEQYRVESRPELLLDILKNI
jgi:hypothetical protein